MEKEILISTVTLAQSGDNDALNTLFNEYYNDLYYFALKTVKDDETALDVTQEAFVEIINTLGNLKEPAAFVTWAKQITYHQCTRYFKKKKDVLVDEDEEGNTVFDSLKEENAEFIPDEALDKADFKKTVLSILDELSEEQRSATMMYYFDEMSVRQIAEIQGVSEGTVKSRLNYARKTIKNSVEEYEKKNGIKLHAIPFFPFFKWLFEGSFKGGLPLDTAKNLAEAIGAATGKTVAATAATATTTAVTTAASTVAAGIGAKIAALPLVTKIIAGVLAASIAIGGVAAVVLTRNNDDKIPSNNQTVSSQSNSSSKPADNQTTSKHEHEWSEWDIEEQKYGVIPYEIKTRKCASCNDTETVNEIEDSYSFIEKHFGEQSTISDIYFSTIMPQFSSTGNYDINALLKVGDYLAWNDAGLFDYTEVEISADKYLENLQKYFVLDNYTLTLLNKSRPERTYKITYSYDGAFLDLGFCKYIGGNRYELYTNHAGSHAADFPFFTVEVEYNLHTGGENKILSIKENNDIIYESSRRSSIAISLEGSISAVAEKTKGFSGYTAGDRLLYDNDIEETYELLSSMDIFGYHLTKEEMLNKQWGAVEIEKTNDIVSSVTARFEFPFFSPGAGFHGSYEDEKLNLENAKTDITRFTYLVGKEKVKVKITENNVSREIGLEDLTDEVISSIIEQWSFSEEYNICIYTAEPLTINGIKCNLSITVAGSRCMVNNAYNMSFSISFL